MKSKKAKVVKVILIVLAIVAVLVLVHFAGNNLIPWIQQIHGR